MMVRAKAIRGEPVSLSQMAALAGLPRNLFHYWVGRVGIELHRMDRRLYAYEDEIPAILEKIAQARLREFQEAGSSPDLVSVREAAELATVTTSTAYALIRMARWPAVRRGRRLYVRKRDVEAYIQRRRKRKVEVKV